MRLEPLTELSPRQAALRDRIAGNRRGLPGPFQVWIRSPELCDRVEALATYCQHGSPLPERLRELILMLVARHFGARHQWDAHLDKATAAGLDPRALERLDAGEEPEFTKPDEQALYRLVTELLETHFVDDAAFTEAYNELGETGLVEVIGSLGNYSMFAILVNAFQV
jgi:4-carboxymuconolactone decarboxylase